MYRGGNLYVCLGLYVCVRLHLRVCVCGARRTMTIQ
jgi:hypothetical protein